MQQALHTLALGLLASLTLVGCNSTDPALDDDGDRTISVQSSRDTALAVEENEQGLAHMDAGELYQAELAFKTAIEADPQFGPAHNNLGRIYFLQSNYYLAAHQFSMAIDLMPNHAAPHNNLGLTVLEGGHLDDAIGYFRQAVRLDPDTIAYQANLVRTLIQRGNEEDADRINTLLRNVAEGDDRIAWREWAYHQLAMRDAE